MKRFTKRWIRSVALLGVAAVLAVLIWQPASFRGADQVIASEASDEGSRNTAIPVAVVRVGSVLSPTLAPSFAGMLTARRDSNLSFQRGGRIIAIETEEGDSVRQGDVLAKLDVTGIDATQKRVQAELAASEAILQDRLAGPRTQTISAAGALVRQLESRLELARADQQRQERLTARGAGSSQEFDSANFGRQAMEQQLTAAKLQLDLLQQGTRKEQIAAQRASRDAILGQLAEIESTRQDSIIVAPFDGQVASRHVDPGVVVSTGFPCMRLLSHELEGRFGIPPAIASSLEIGDAVRVSAGNEACQGNIVRIEPLVDQVTRTRAVYVAIDLGPNWVSGQVASVHLPISSAAATQNNNSDVQGSFWLPTSSLSRGGRGVWTVLTMQGDHPEATVTRRSVELLRTDGSVSLVRGMIERGDRVIAVGTHRITAGMLVRSQESGAK